MIEYGYDTSQCSPVRRTITGVNKITGKAYGCTAWVKVSHEEYAAARVQMDREQRQLQIIARQEDQHRDRDRWIGEAALRDARTFESLAPAPTIDQRRQRYETVAERDERRRAQEEIRRQREKQEEIRRRWAAYPKPGERCTITTYDDGRIEVGGPGIEEEIRQLAALDDFEELETVPEEINYAL